MIRPRLYASEHQRRLGAPQAVAVPEEEVDDVPLRHILCMCVYIYIYIYIYIHTYIYIYRYMYLSLSLYIYIYSTCLQVAVEVVVHCREGDTLRAVGRAWILCRGGCSRRGVQWIGVVLYDKLVYNMAQITTPGFHCTPLAECICREPNDTHGRPSAHRPDKYTYIYIYIYLYLYLSIYLSIIIIIIIIILYVYIYIYTYTHTWGQGPRVA